MGYYLSRKYRDKIRAVGTQDPIEPSEVDTLRSENSAMKSQIAALESERDALLAAATEPASKQDQIRQERSGKR